MASKSVILTIAILRRLAARRSDLLALQRAPAKTPDSIIGNTAGCGAVGSAPGLGPGGREFKSPLPDQLIQIVSNAKREQNVSRLRQRKVRVVHFL